MPSRTTERGQILSWDTLEVTHDVECLLKEIEELDSAIARDMDALSRAESKHASSDLWARIDRKIAARRELRERLPGPSTPD
jgi:hypothetical protein